MLLNEVNKKLFLLGGFCLLSAGSCFAEEIAPPPYSTIDRLGVNLAAGHVQINQVDVSIGGALGLSNTVGTHTSEYCNYEIGKWGFRNGFEGYVKGRYFKGTSSFQDYVPIVRVAGDGINTEFTFGLVNGDYVYTPMRDPRFSLEMVDGVGLVFTKPDGTELIYETDGVDYEPSAFSSYVWLKKIVRPNGFTTTIHYQSSASEIVSSVTTNTGFQLKYLYELDNRPMDAVKAASTYEVNVPSAGWWGSVPKHTLGLNNAVETCPTTNASCAPSGNWPMSTYDWPAGMPRVMYIGENDFNVTDAEGRITTYRHTGIDKAILNSEGAPSTGIQPGTRSQPRITSIIRPDGTETSYTYENTSQYISGPMPTPGYYTPKDYAVLKTANRHGDTGGYSINNKMGFYNVYINGGGSFQGVFKTEYNAQYEKITAIDMWDKSISMGLPNTSGYYIGVSRIFNKQTGIRTTFEIDDRLNIIAKLDADNDLYMAKAGYATTCDSTNRKYCNQAEWLEDANGNRTNYTYHAESGQVATVALPADENGVRSQHRYGYAQYSATHSGPDTSPIWLLATEKTCRNSATTNDACTGSDEVVTSYEYDTKNLFLIGVAITADGQTLRSCFHYDIYGNQIGRTEPNANVSSCAYN